MNGNCCINITVINVQYYGMCFTWAAFIDCLPLFRTSELQSRLSAVREQLQGAEEDLEEVQGERNAKYRELRKREDTMKGAAIPGLQLDLGRCVLRCWSKLHAHIS